MLERERRQHLSMARALRDVSAAGHGPLRRPCSWGGGVGRGVTVRDAGLSPRPLMEGSARASEA